MAVAGRIVLPCELNAARSCIAKFQADVAFFPEVFMDPITYFLAFARLGSVQAVTWGHPVTTGVTNMDYFLSCNDAEPADSNDANEQCSKTRVRLDGYPFSYPRPPVLKPAGARAAFALPEDATVYFLAQNLFKIHPDMDAALRRFLMAIENGALSPGRSRSGFGAKPSGNGLPKLCATRHCGLWSQNVSRTTITCGSSPSRMSCSIAIPSPAGIRPIKRLRWEYPSSLTPAVIFGGRFSTATCERMGMSELVAGDMAEFADIALRLGTDDGYRREIRNRRAQTSDAIFDDPVYLAAIERFLMTAARLLGGQYQVVAVDEFVSATIAEDRCDLSALATGDPERIAVRVSGQPTGELRPALQRTMTASPRSKLPLTRTTPAGSKLFPCSKARLAPSSITISPMGFSDPTIQRLRALSGVAEGINHVQRASSDNRLSGWASIPFMIAIRHPAAIATFAALIWSPFHPTNNPSVLCRTSLQFRA